MSSITIRQATVADAAEIARVHYSALDKFNEFYVTFFATHPAEALPHSTKIALAKPDTTFLVAEDASGTIVGFVRYTMVDPAADAAKKEAEEKEPEKKEADEKESVSAAPSLASLFATKEHLTEMFKKVTAQEDLRDAIYEKAADGQRHIYTNHVMVDLAHQRKGIGGQLLGRVTALSDAEGLPTFLVSSGEAYGLYARAGFEDLGRWEIDSGYWAGEVERVERELGIKGVEGFADRFRGLKEVETVMVRRPGKAE